MISPTTSSNRSSKRHQSHHAAEFVDDDRHVPFVGLELFHQIVRSLSSRDEERRSGHVLQLGIVPALGQPHQRLVTIENAGNIIQRRIVDGNAGILGFERSPPAHPSIVNFLRAQTYRCAVSSRLQR